MATDADRRLDGRPARGRLDGLAARRGSRRRADRRPAPMLRRDRGDRPRLSPRPSRDPARGDGAAAARARPAQAVDAAPRRARDALPRRLGRRRRWRRRAGRVLRLCLRLLPRSQCRRRAAAARGSAAEGGLARIAGARPGQRGGRHASLAAARAGPLPRRSTTACSRSAGRPRPSIAAGAAGGRRRRRRAPSRRDRAPSSQRNFELARAIGATGTPTFVVGDQVLQGAVGYDALKAAIAEARARDQGLRFVRERLQSQSRIPVPNQPLEPLRHDIPFGRALAAGRRLGVLDGGEAALELGDQVGVGAAGQHLGDEGAAGLQHLGGEVERRPRPGPWCADDRSADGRPCWRPCRRGRGRPGRRAPP